MTTATIVAVAAAVCAAVLSAVLSYRYVSSAFGSIDALFDRILSKDTRLSVMSAEDSRISKLTHKAARIVGMYVSDAQHADAEKQAIQSYISDMSHQMKTPLAGISMYSSLLLEEKLSGEEQREFISRIYSCSEKLQWMMDCLIKMSRLEAGTIQLSPRGCGIKQTLTDSLSSVLPAAEKKDVAITVSEFGDFPVYHDRKWTREVFANILENAVKYSPEGGTVKISLDTMSLYTKVTVTDHGIGIDREDWNLVFKRFYRGRNTKDYEGVGLGLYIASLIMEKQGGYIMVDSRQGEYTSFSVFLQNRKN